MALYNEALAHQASEVSAGRHDMGFHKLRQQPVAQLHLDAKSLLAGPLDNGLLSNVLHVLDVAMLSNRTGGPGVASLVVLWPRIDSQTQFTYGDAKDDVWRSTFEPIVPNQKNDAFATAMRADKATHLGGPGARGRGGSRLGLNLHMRATWTPRGAPSACD